MENTISTFRKWIENDQYSYGEFGKHEIVSPTDLPRTFEKSLIKPNVYSSILAYTSLCATGPVSAECQELFHDWLKESRSASGYWTSASGKTTPFSKVESWARNNNLRHTAKCLDYYLLSGKFRFQDANIFNEIIECQMDNGSFPQFQGMDSDLWSTAYFVNLLIRATMEQNIKATLPNDKDEEKWKNELTNRLNRAVEWLIHVLDDDSMWGVTEADRVVITLAMMAEIGGYLALHNPESCASIIRNLLGMNERSPLFVYVACLVLDTLKPKEQEIILNLYEDIVNNNQIVPKDLLEATSLCKLHFINKNIGLLLYYRDISNGHETQLISSTEWNHNEYFCWSIEFANNNPSGIQNPLKEAEFWQYVRDAIKDIKNTIENSRGWQLLWNEDKHVDEEKVQIYLDSQLKSICDTKKISVTRELETGRGPVDFVFSNGYANKCMLEVKLSSNAALKNGDFMAQIYEYAKGEKLSAAFLVVVQFEGKVQKIIDSVNEYILLFRKEYNNFYIQPIYIDATKKVGASKTKWTDME